ncbi:MULTISPECIES: helix-turn-helix domain-containing protein [unclassified Sphingomonas]|uniref:helix-turn-helix domain-containing protein n=1 Tax=unclassified Sphingomonas TaxID=196159 RepID=UPI0006FB5844|nr:MULTISPECIES: XRE family transcriptional regulator [unclassified Sphingomonas]KQX25022.1 hypothetical protein ASD17_23350 [Sphingomonas sp. Root1294]KQY66039.1 hypothetical protein ASD39_13150 [Sphingomonas sp. Root50]KRB89796.1 hypothetical protein ASE22_19445 [Sphingomonas sp. Root720]
MDNRAEQALTLASALRSIRQEHGWTLADASKVTGLSISTLSKIENGQRSLSYDKLVALAAKLSVDVSRLFGDRTRPSAPPPSFAGRRSVHRTGEGFQVSTRPYTYNYLAHDLIKKRFIPSLIEIHATSLGDFEHMMKHKGDEFVYVIEGEIEVHTEIYAPLRLRAGESVFFDSGVGHAYVKIGDATARILCVDSDVDDVVSDEAISPYPLTSDR